MILILCQLSGLTGLAYEVVWARYLALLLGNTALAHAVVLSAFMGGLALGNWVLGPRADKARFPLVFYGTLEVGIACLGAATPLLFKAAGAVYDWSSGLGLPFWASWVFQVLPGLLLVAAPATLMGGTLPALSRAMTGWGHSVQSAVARLYFFNCYGAVLGALAAGFLLVPMLGLDGTVYAAAALNLGVGLAARAWGKIPALELLPEEKPSEATVLTPAAVLAVVFVSGAAAFAYEIAWTRLLALVIGSSVYSFCVMLAGFIAGIAAGSLALAWRPLTKVRAELLFGLTQLGVAFSILLTLPFYGRLPYWFLRLALWTRTFPESFYVNETAKLGFCFLLMLLPAAFLGMSLPLASRLAPGETGRRVGSVFAFNTIGNVLGAFAGVWLLPILGLDGLIKAGTTVNLAIGLAVLAVVVSWEGRRKALLLGGLAALAVALRLAAPPLERLHLSVGSYRNRTGMKDFKEYLSYYKELKLLFNRDDRNATVSVVLYPKGTVSLKVNGKTDASNGTDMATQVLLAHVPMLLKPETKEILMVGWGSGITAGSLLTHPIERLEVAEISRGVVEASEFFRKENRDALLDERVVLHLEDAKTFLRRARGSYDLIISEPSNPWVAGVAGLFTREFYRDVRARLKDGGLMAQWFHVYEMDDEGLRLVVRTFAASFEHVTMWSIASGDILLLGSREPLEVDVSASILAGLRPEARLGLVKIGLHTVPGVLSLQSGTDATVRELGGKGPLNSDQYPILEYQAPKAFFSGKRSKLALEYDDRLRPGRREGLLLAEFESKRTPKLAAFEFLDMLLYKRDSSEDPVRRQFLRQMIDRYPKDKRAKVLAGELGLY